MKITATMKRESRNNGFASPVLHPKKWPPWSDYPYHRDGAARIKHMILPQDFMDICEDRQAFKGWVKDQRAFWKDVVTQLKTGTFIAIQ